MSFFFRVRMELALQQVDWQVCQWGLQPPVKRQLGFSPSIIIMNGIDFRSSHGASGNVLKRGNNSISKAMVSML
jgi:hypothetical protein